MDSTVVQRTALGYELERLQQELQRLRQRFQSLRPSGDDPRMRGSEFLRAYV